MSRSTSRAAPAKDRAGLIAEHAASRARRDAASLGSAEFRAAAEEIARIEIAIAQLEEPPPGPPSDAGDRAPRQSRSKARRPAAR